MKQYRITEQGLFNSKRRFLLTRLLVILLSTAVALTISHFAFNLDLWIQGILIAMVSVMFVAIIIPAANQFVLSLKTYQLSIDETAFIRDQSGLPRLSILKEQIKKVQMHPDGTLEIEAGVNRLYIPFDIENRDEIVSSLPVSAQKIQSNLVILKFALGFILVTLALALVFLSKSHSLVSISAAGLALLSVWGTYDVYKRSKKVNVWIIIGTISFLYLILSRLFDVLRK